MARIFFTNSSPRSIFATTDYPPQLSNVAGDIPPSQGLEAYGILTLTTNSEFGGNGGADGEFRAPHHMVFDSITTQSMLVTDKNNDRIQFFDDLSGTPLKVESTGTDSNPVGIGLHPTTGDYYVAQDETTPLIRVYRPSDFMEINDFGAGDFSSVLHDIKIGQDSKNAYVLEGGTPSKIHVFDENGNPITSFSLANNANSQGISLDSSENIYVADRANEQIQIYASDGGGTDPGTPLSLKGGPGTIGGRFDGLLNIHVEQSQDKLITSEDGTAKRLQFFNLSGVLQSNIDIVPHFITSFNNGGGGNWTKPFGIEFFTNSILFVSDQSQDKVTVIDVDVPEQNILFDETGMGGSGLTGNVEYIQN